MIPSSLGDIFSIRLLPMLLFEETGWPLPTLKQLTINITCIFTLEGKEKAKHLPLKQHGYFFELLLSQDFSCSALTCFQQKPGSGNYWWSTWEDPLDCAKMKTNVEEISQYLRMFQRGSDYLEPAVVVVDVATVAVAFSLSLLFVLARCSWKV